MTGEPWPPSPTPVPAPPASPAPGTKLGEVRFSFDCAYLTQANREYLIRLVREVSPGTRITIEGHTDRVGSYAYNDRLSYRRAQAVADVLMAMPLELTVTWFGETRAGGVDAAADRRVVLRVP
jgi:OmpA-OmpF porin, OOP family